MKGSIIGKDRTSKIRFLVLNLLLTAAFTCLSIVMLANRREEMGIGIFLLIFLIPLLHWWLYQYVRRPDFVDFGKKGIYMIHLFLMFLAAFMMVQAFGGLHDQYISYSIVLCCLIVQNKILTRSFYAVGNDEVEKQETAVKEKQK